MKRFFLMILAAVAALSCSDDEPEVKNVIYLIGDGMGFGAVSSLLLTADEPTGFELLNPTIGLSETSSADNLVTDSAAGGTALACGARTHNDWVGLTPDGEQLTSILKKAQQMGKKSGIVVNTILTEATPAAFYAGAKSRSEFDTILGQLVESGVDVAIGAGLDHIVAHSESVKITEALIGKGYDLFMDWKAVLDNSSDKYMGILPMSNVHRRAKKAKAAGAADGAEVCIAAQLASETGVKLSDSTSFCEPEQYLEKAVAKGLTTLERIGSKDGFFLMIESAIIDGYGHNNDTEGMIEEMLEFNNTLKYLVDYVNKHPETLLVVTADHETGGTSVSYKRHEVGEKVPVNLSFNTKGHTGTVVPLFAYGAGAEKFSGVHKNYEIPAIIEGLMVDNR